MAIPSPPSESEEFGVLVELDWRGDKKSRWRRIRLRKGTIVEGELLPSDVEAARQRFNAKIAAGFEAYALRGDGYLFEKGQQVTRFDPDAKVIFLAPRQQGGRDSGYS
jgi:hypothetical protein